MVSVDDKMSTGTWDEYDVRLHSYTFCNRAQETLSCIQAVYKFSYIAVAEFFVQPPSPKNAAKPIDFVG